MPEQKIKVQKGFNGEEMEFETAKELKDYMCHNGRGHIVVGTDFVGLNDDNIDTVLGGCDKAQLVQISCTEKKAIAIGEGIIYLNKHLNDEQKGRIREKFKDKKLEDIIELNLNGLGLKALPESFGNLFALEVLNLHFNHLTELPKSIGNLFALEVLNLWSNKLTTLPDSIENLAALKQLNLWSNKLTTLPESIGKLESLKEFHLSDNKLTTLPESFGKLTTLEVLDLWSNYLNTLPELIGKLAALRELHLSDNKLIAIPKSIRNIRNLSTLDLSDNPLPDGQRKIYSGDELIKLRGDINKHMTPSINPIPSGAEASGKIVVCNTQ